MKKTTVLIVITIHTILMIVVFPYQSLSKSLGESWSFFFPFFLDFPVSILFHKALGLLNEVTAQIDIGLWWLSFAHLVLGAIWWLLVVKVISVFYLVVKKSFKTDKEA